MEDILKEKTAQAVEKLYGHKMSPGEVQVNIPPKDFPFDFTVVVFPFSRISKKSPDQTAREIGEELRATFPELERFEAIKGFLNIQLNDQFWIKFIEEKAGDSSFGQIPPTSGKVMV